MATCGACTAEIRTCDECGGLICTKGCVDRMEDGCLCDQEEEEEDDEE